MFLLGVRMKRWTEKKERKHLYQPSTLAETTIAEVKRKKNPLALDRLRFEEFSEGPSARSMRRGESRLRGKHHEIYLNDIRKSAPAKWKTIIRQPMQLS